MTRRHIVFYRLQILGKQWNQDGAALLSVLLITALITIMAVSMVSRQQIDIRRTANVIEGEQAYYLAKGGERWAARLLIRDRNSGPKDHLAENWAQGLPPVPVAGGMVSGVIVDLQGLFNVNNLLASDSILRDNSRSQFVRLLNFCQLEPEVMEAVVDWIDDDGDIGLAEDWAYGNLDPPYRTANQPLISPSELLQVQGMNARGFQCLAPFLSTLPAGTQININTAPAMIIASLTDDISPLEAEKMIARRPANGYATIADFLAEPELTASELTENSLTLSSDFFLVQSRASMGRGKNTLFSLLQRRGNGVTVLQRTMGTY
jgi:general secretion pathway protein K